MTVKTAWEVVVGLEVHVQLRTASKIFCSCPTTFGDAPNVNTCPVCLGLPGALPVLNEGAVALAVRAALALGCDLHGTSVFARKNYFYPDLPKGYQITQFDRPFATGGEVCLDDDGTRCIRLTRIHMEEDAGKSVHDRYPGETAIDLNRAGVPLIEIVTEPEIRSAPEARSCLQHLREVLEFTGVSDANMEEGSLRVDANISIRASGSQQLGTRTEIKNMNSFSGVERAIELEAARQADVLDSGGAIVQQTMLWDGQRGEVRPARSKEGSHDYRYFPEPDLPPLQLDRAWITQQRDALPELPAPRRARLRARHGLSAYDAGVLTSSKALADFYEELTALHSDARAAATWVMGEVLGWLREQRLGIADFVLRPADLASLLDSVRDGGLSRTAAKRVFDIMVREGGNVAAIVEREGLGQVGDDAALRAWVDLVWTGNPAEAARLVAGERKLLGVLVGLVMKASGGRADPRRVNALLQERASRA